ncbi:MAG: M28 family peptidase [Porphyromonas sp.]|nr:M28 family peptidase [Porphyromonas sp.]
MDKYPSIIIIIAALLLSAASCDNRKKSTSTETEGETATQRVLDPSPFSAHNAYRHIEAQVGSGPRVPNTEGHAQTADYIARHLEASGLQVIRQEALLTAYDGTPLKAVNLIGSYRPEATRRVMIFAHWDTRPFADHDPDPRRRKEPIPGADDGASGPGVMLELARLLSEKGLENIGVDFMFFDAEDYGVPDWEKRHNTNTEETWALGTQYWTKHPHKQGYTADFGILLDMVGAKDAVFKREYFSQESAGPIVTKIWQTAKELGHGNYFVNKTGGAITDDHYFVINNLRIPCVDIINYDNDFGSYWHTHSDSLENISKETLQAVGETVWQVLMDYDRTIRE